MTPFKTNEYQSYQHSLNANCVFIIFCFCKIAHKKECTQLNSDSNVNTKQSIHIKKFKCCVHIANFTSQILRLHFHKFKLYSYLYLRADINFKRVFRKKIFTKHSQMRICLIQKWWSGKYFDLINKILVSNCQKVMEYIITLYQYSSLGLLSIHFN